MSFTTQAQRYHLWLQNHGQTPFPAGHLTFRLSFKVLILFFCSLRMKNFRIIPFFLTLAPNQPDHCSAPNINISKSTHNTLLSQNISTHSVSPFPHTFLSFLFQIKLVSLFPSSSVSERNKARVLLPLTFFHNDDKACAPVLASGSPVVFCSRSHYKLIIRIMR